MEEERITELLDFDSEVFFKVLRLLFKGQPWKFFFKMRKTSLFKKS